MTRRTWLVAGVAVAAGVVVVAGAIAVAAGGGSSSDAQGPPSTAAVEKGDLAAVISAAGTLGYKARPDGSPYTVLNQAHGIYTGLPVAGDRIGCGEVLYRVDGDPVLLLCGAAPIYRDLRAGDTGNDVRQLNRNLRKLGYDRAAGIRIDRGERDFTWETAAALRELQKRRGVAATGTLGIGEVVFLPGPARISELSAELGESARPGAQVAQATSNALAIRVALDPSQQGDVSKGDPVQITLPGNRPATGKVASVGRVAEAPDKQSDDSAGATIPAYVTLDHPEQAPALDSAPVQVQITTRGVRDVLSVPVTAIVGKSGGGYAVEVVRGGGARELVAVRLGLFDTSGGRVQVEGAVRAGDRVVVPAP